MKLINIWDDKAPINKENGAFTPYMSYHKAENSINKTILVIPGGGYVNCCDTYEGEDIAEYFTSFGVDAFVLRYHVTGLNNNKPVFPLPYLDITRAIRYIRANSEELNVNADSIGVIGFSAGAHLCSWVSTKPNEKYPNDKYTDDLADRYSARPDWCVLCYGVLDLHKITNFGVTGVNLFGENPDEKLLASVSGPEHVTKDTPPTFLFHTFSDQTVPVLNSIKYYEAMAKNSVRGEIHIYEPGSHGMGIAIPVPHIKEEDRKYCEHWPDLLKKWVMEKA